MKNDILSEYYRPLLERNNFLRFHVRRNSVLRDNAGKLNQK